MHLVLGQSALLYVSSTFVSWWREQNDYTLRIDGARTRWHRNEASELESSSTTSTDDQELLTSSTSSLVFFVRLSVSVWFSFLFRKPRFVLFCIRFQTSRFSFASSLIEESSDILSTLLYVCVKRNICWNLWLVNILDFVFYWCNYHVVFPVSQFIATFYEGECYGNVGACPCTGQCSVALLLCVS